ncbi:MAG: aspartate carbamoyltransferase [Clostridia bacterium]|nr:aspartate carbamoyltransferase [Clostridia bacterium]
MRNLVDILDFSVEEIDGLVKTANDIIENPEMYSDSCRGKILGTLFFEPSTRTRLSFTSAMMSLGGSVLGFSQAASTSVSKGETVSDTIRMVSAYSDIIAMRHPKEGAPIVASRVSSVPIINAGDGGHFHPTQTLTDLLTINRKKGRFTDMTVGICGDLKYGRTVHSLISAMTRYEGVKFVLISPKELALPDYVKADFLDKCSSEYVECESLEDAIPSLDILYMTRIQAERFDSPEEYERLKDSYVLTKEKLKDAKPDLSIMHPLPRVNEISTDVDDDPRADYFDQAKFGRYIRMALILMLLKTKSVSDVRTGGEEDPTLICKNPHCISMTERGIKRLFKGGACIYCDQKASKV